MMIKVIRTDGTSGKVRSSHFGTTLKSGEIAAYQCSEGWIEVRRVRNGDNYRGFEKRKSETDGMENTLETIIE